MPLYYAIILCSLAHLSSLAHLEPSGRKGSLPPLRGGREASFARSPLLPPSPDGGGGREGGGRVLHRQIPYSELKVRKKKLKHGN